MSNLELIFLKHKYEILVDCGRFFGQLRTFGINFNKYFTKGTFIEKTIVEKFSAKNSDNQAFWTDAFFGNQINYDCGN